MSNELPASISRARIQLMLRHTYLASAAARLKFRMTEEPWCKTMATDGFNIFINYEFTLKLTEDEIIGVFAHEIMHCVLGHIDRRGNRNPEIWNIAIDYATNLMLFDAGVVLPKTGLLDNAYKGMTAEDIYSVVSALSKQQLEKLILKVGAGIGSGNKNNLNQADDTNFTDIHLDVGDLKGQWARVDEFPTDAERLRMRRSWQEELKSKLPGTISGSSAEEITKAGHQEVNWRDFFSKFVTGLRRDDYRLFPSNKKHIWRQIYLPSFGSPGPDHIVVVIDTSGSMDAKILGKVITEIDAARQMCECKLTILQCDIAIKSVETFEPWELLEQDLNTMKMLGRGGTSFKQPFEWVDGYVNEGHPYPDALIYMTDGYGDFPSDPPGYPCLWIVPDSGSSVFPFGDMVRVAVEN